jgi:hypothetical protein
MESGLPYQLGVWRGSGTRRAGARQASTRWQEGKARWFVTTPRASTYGHAVLPMSMISNLIQHRAIQSCSLLIFRIRGRPEISYHAYVPVRTSQATESSSPEQ